MDNNIFNKKIDEGELKLIKNKYNLNYKYILLFVGRHSEEKGLLYLLEAVKLLPEDLNVGLILIGEGEEKDNIKNYSKTIMLNNVLFLNYIPNTDLIKYYALADLFILPSITTKRIKETWGVVVNEAMNQGCPVIASSAVGAAVGGLIQEGKNGFIFPEKNVKALSECINNLLSNPEKLNKMKQFTYEEIQKWDNIKSFSGFDKAIKFCIEKRK